NLAECGINTACYNFMPVTDWTRTHLNYPLANRATALRFDFTAFVASELFILESEGAKRDYSHSQQSKATRFDDELSDDEISQLTKAILIGLPGNDGLTLPKFRKLLQE